MSMVNGFQVGSEVLKYNAEALENYNTPDFDSTSTYEIGDYVMHLGKLYKCIQDITIAGDWDTNDWELAVLSNDVKSLVTSIANIDNSIADDFQANHLYSSGDIIMHENILYKCIPTTLQTDSFNPLDWEATTIDYVINNSSDDSIPSGGTENQYLMKNSNTDYDLKWSNLIEGTGNTPSGSNSHAEGYNTTASGNYGSHSEGRSTTASGSSSHAEGNNTVASGMHSHAEGSYTTASYDYAHAEGDNTQSSGYSSHAEGSGSIASNTNSHAEGGHTTASGRYAHSEGQHTEANHRSQHVFGEYNVVDDSSATANNRGNYVEIVGNGTANNAKSNARTLDWDGNEKLSGNLTINAGSANEISVSGINVKATNIGNELEDTQESIADTHAVFTMPDSTIHSLKALPKGTYFWINDHVAVTTVDVAFGDTMTEHTNYEFTVIGDEVSDLKSAFDYYSLTVNAGAPSKADVPFIKGRKYKVTNNSTANVNIRVDDINGTTTVLENGVNPNAVYEFVCSSSTWAKINLYFSGTGTCLLESSDSGAFQAITDLQDAIAPIQNLNDDVINIEYAAGVFKNIANPSDFISGGVWRQSDIYSASGYYRTEIPVIPNHKYTLANCHPSYSWWCTSDDTRNAVGNGVFTAPSTCVSLKLSAKDSSGTIVVLDTDYNGTVTATDFPYGSWFSKVDINTIMSAIRTTVPTRDYTSISMFPSVAVIGDSYESGGIYVDEDTGPYGAYYDYSWVSVMQRRCGSTMNNYSAPGLSTRTWLTNAEHGLAQALSDTASDFYMFFLGINDYGITGYLGSIADIKADYTQNPDTFYGNYARIIEQLQNHAPDAKMVMVVPPLITPEYASAIEEIASHYNIPSFRSTSDEFFTSSFYTNNRATGHPVAITYAGMALAYERLVSLCIQNNTAYFFNVPLN